MYHRDAGECCVWLERDSEIPKHSWAPRKGPVPKQIMNESPIPRRWLLHGAPCLDTRLKKRTQRGPGAQCPPRAASIAKTKRRFSGGPHSLASFRSPPSPSQAEERCCEGLKECCIVPLSPTQSMEWYRHPHSGLLVAVCVGSEDLQPQGGYDSKRHEIGLDPAEHASQGM